MPLLTDENLHGLARAAVESMDRMAAQTAGHINAFHERQFVFEMGAKLRDGALTYGTDIWTAFEYGYPNGLGNGGFDSTKCDIVCWLRPDQAGPRYAWIEAKSTGLDESGRWDNAFSALAWEYDLEKLRTCVGRKDWHAEHDAGWAWLYLFPTYRAEVRAAWGVVSGWRGPMKPTEIGAKFGSASVNRVNLPAVLAAIEAAVPSARASIRPRIRSFASAEPGPTDLDASALVVTALVGTT